MTHTPNKLPPLTIDLGTDAYGLESIYIQHEKPATPELAIKAFELCKLAVDRQSQRIENPYPAHIGGVDRLLILQALARERGVGLQFPLAREME